MAGQLILVALYPVVTKADEEDGKGLSAFKAALRLAMGQSGVEDQTSSEEVLIYRFERLSYAMTTLYKFFDAYRKEGFSGADGDPLPLKVIIHNIEKQGGAKPAFCQSEASEWGAIQCEYFYVTRTLKLQWHQLLGEKKEIPCNFNLEACGLYRLEFRSRPDFTAIKLFKYRHLISQGNRKSCFYCGMRNHVPSKCPSKLLGMDARGLHLLGYYSFKKINELAPKVFSSTQELSNKLLAGINKSQLKKDPELFFFIAYLDVFLLFQPRFLTKIAFSPYAKWEAVLGNEKMQIDDSNLNMALDCLRVGQHEEAEKRLMAATDHQQEKMLYGYVGLAFLALERDRLQDMGHFLDTALSNASGEKEKTYVNLLLCRYFLLVGDLWKAQYALKALTKVNPDLPEVRYMRVIIELSSGFSEKGLGELRSIMNVTREYFMIIMLDPRLLPLQGFIDEMLQARLDSVAKDAKEQLSLARSDVAEMQVWLKEGDSDSKSLADALAMLESQSKTRNYYDLVDIWENSRELCGECKEIRGRRLDELQEKKDKRGKRYNEFVQYWRRYPYQAVFRGVTAALADIGPLLTEVDRYVKLATGESYERGLKAYEKIEVPMQELEKTFQKMESFAELCEKGKLFGKKLLLIEGVCLALTILQPLIFAFLPEGSSVEPLLQTRDYLVIFLMVAPAIALTLTLIELGKGSESA